MGMTNLQEVEGWCISNNAVLDVPLPIKPTKVAQDRTKKFQEAAKAAVDEHHSAGRSTVVYREGRVVEIPPAEEQKEKKIKSLQKEEGDPSSKSD